MNILKKRLFAATVLGAFILITILGIHSSNSTVEAENVKEKYFICIDIEAGDTLSGLAEEYAGISSVTKSAFIDEVKKVNHLNGSNITAGECLIVPVYK